MNINKLIWAVLGAVALTLQGALSDGMSAADWVLTGAAVLAALGTWLVPNTPALETAKTWVNALVIGAGVLLQVLPDGVSSQEIWTVIIGVLTAAGVYMVPNVVRAGDGMPAGWPVDTNAPQHRAD